MIFCAWIPVLHAATTVSGAIQSNSVWTLAQSPYQVTGDVTIENGAVLTIEPGVIVYMDANTHLTVNAGGLKAQGTALAPIVFTSFKDTVSTTPAPGDWGQLRLLDGTNDTATILEHVHVKYGHGITVQSASPTFNFLKITNNVGPAISIDLKSSPQGMGNLAANNSLNGVAVPAGDITGNVAWKLKGIPYVVSQGTVSVGQTPAVTAINPSQIQREETLDVTVSGTRLSGIEGVKFDDPNITATILPGGTDNLVSLRISAGAAAALGPAAFQIQLPAGLARFDVGINVVPKQPKINVVSPASICLNQAIEITISGVNFLATSIATLDGVDLATTFVSATSIKAAVPSQSMVGKKSIRLKTPNPEVPGDVFLSNAAEIQVNDCSLLCAAPPTGLVAWWTGDASANDIAGVNHGTLQNGASFALGKVGQAFSFDGVNDSVVVPDSANLDLTTSFTLAAWINPSSLQQDPQRGAMISKIGGAGGNNGYQFGITNQNAAIFCQFNSPGEPWPANQLFIPLTSPIPVGQWSHVACTYDNNSLRIYVNGVLAGTKLVGAKSVVNSASNLRISGDDNNNVFFHGLIDEAAIHNRALTAAEVQAIFVAGTAGMCKLQQCTAPQPGLISWWPFDQSVTNVATDIVGGKDGSLSGTTLVNGLVSSARRFAQNDVMTAPGDGPLDITGNQVSINAWVKLENRPTAAQTFTGVVGKTTFPDKQSYQFVFESGPIGGNTSNTLPQDQWQLEYILTNAAGTRVHNQSTNIIVAADGRYHHIALTYDGVNVRMYVDGAIKGTFPFSGNLKSIPAEPIKIYGFAPFSIDEVQIHNRALTAGEIAALFVAGGAGVCRPCTTPPSGLVGWWPGDGDANDIIGANHGSLQNGATFAPGRVDQAFSFDGVDDYVTRPLPNDVKVQTITMSGWVKLNVNDVVQTVMFAEPRGANAVGLGAGIFIGQNGKVVFNKGGPGVALYDQLVGSTTVTTGIWHHVAATYDGATMRIYVDGVEDAAVANTQGIDWVDMPAGNFPDPGQLYFGAYKSNQIGSGPTIPDQFFLNGLLDELTIYNRALSAAEIQSIFAAGNAGMCKTPCAPPPSGGVSRWSGEGNANDIAGVNHGTLQNGAAFAAGKVGQTFSFDGVNDYVLVPDAPALTFTTALTIDFWMFPKAVGSAGGDLATVWKGNISDANDQSFGMLWLDSGSIGLRIGGTSGLDQIFSAQPLLLNKWTHVAGTYNGSVLKIYIDGVLSAEKATTITALKDTLQPLLIGASFLGAGTSGAPFKFFNGLLDEVAVHNRALSAQEIQTIFAAGSTGMCKTAVCTPAPTGTVSWWPGDGNANDIVGTNHGTIQNGVIFTPGEVGQALTFDGVNGHVKFGNSVGNFGTADFTIQFWIKTISTRVEGVIGKRLSCNHSNFWDIRTGAIGYIGLELDQSGTNYNSIATQRKINDNIFHHVAVVRQGATASIYIDGVLDVSGTTTGVTNLSNTAEFITGRSACTGADGTSSFTGSLDELTVVQRALSAAEIQTVVTADSGGMCKLQCAALSPAPAGWWPGDQNANDIAGVNHGTLQNGATIAPAKVGNGFGLDGVDDFVHVPHNAVIDPGAGSFSVQAWIKTTKSTGTQIIVHKYECGQSCPSGVANSVYSLSTADGKLSVFIRDTDASGPAAFSGGQTLTGTRLIADGQFHHVIMVRDIAAGQLRIYADGVLEASVALNAGANGELKDNDGEADPLVIGASIVGGSTQKVNFFSGMIDEVAFHRHALSDAEIQALFAAGALGMCK